MASGFCCTIRSMDLEFNAHIECDGVSVDSAILKLLQLIAQTEVHCIHKSDRDANAQSRSKIETIKLACCVADFCINKGLDAFAS